MNEKIAMKMEMMKVIKTDNPKGKCGVCYEIYKRKKGKKEGRNGGYTRYHTLLNPGVICDCFSFVKWHKKKC